MVLVKFQTVFFLVVLLTGPLLVLAECELDSCDNGAGCVFNRPKKGGGCVNVCKKATGKGKGPGKKYTPGCNGNCEDGPDVSCVWRRSRVRRDLGEDPSITVEDANQRVQNLRGDPNGFFGSKDSIIEDRSLRSLKEYLEIMYETEGSDPSRLPMGDNLPPEAFYVTYITGAQLIEMIGKDEAAKLYGYFTESFGEAAAVTRIQLQLAINDEYSAYFPPHKDNKNALIVFLDDEEFEGGGVGYYTKDGYTVIEAKKGRALVHGQDSVHEARAFRGRRAIMDLQWRGSDKECILKSLL